MTGKVKSVMQSIIVGVPTLAQKHYGRRWYAPDSRRCPICHGSLVANVDGEQYHCICSLVSRHERYAKAKAQLERVRPEVALPTKNQNAVLAAVKKAALSRKPPRFVVLTGNTGVGKTYLAAYVWQRFGPFGLWIAPSMISQATADYTRELVELGQMFPLVVIDDLGTESTGSANWHKQALYSLVDMRVKEPGVLLTILTTNLTPDQIVEGYGERFKNRISRERGAMWVMMHKGKRPTILEAWK